MDAKLDLFRLVYRAELKIVEIDLMCLLWLELLN